MRLKDAPSTAISSCPAAGLSGTLKSPMLTASAAAAIAWIGRTMIEFSMTLSATNTSANIATSDDMNVMNAWFALRTGSAVGTEIEESQVAIARANAIKLNLPNVSFKVGSIYSLPFEDESFDAVFISAILGNLQEPLKGIRELHRVLKPGGVIGVKEFDHGGDIAYPIDAGIQKYIELYLRLRRENGHDGEAGRKIGVYLTAAGFREPKLSACYENVSEPEILRGMAQLNIGLLNDGWADEYIRRGWATSQDMDEMSQSWLKFSKTPGALLACTWCEAVATK